jgi:hypothetical protein
MANKKSNNRKTKRKYQRGTPPGVNVFKDRDANKAVNTGIATGLASALGRSGVALGQNRALDRDAYNMWMGVKDNSSQFSGYQDFNDYCLTGDCPQRPFQDGAPTFRDWRRGARQGNSDFGNNSINTYRRVAGYEENPLQGKGILKKAGRDAIIGGAVNYGFNKMFPNANIGGIPFKVGYRGFQGGGAAGNPYSMPTSAATSGYTSTMSGMAGAQQSAMQLAQIQQEVMAEQERRKREAEAADAASKAQLQQEAKGLASKEFLGETRDAVRDIRGNRAAKSAAQDAAMKQAATDYGTSLTGAGANATSSIVQGGRMAAEAASPTANIVMNPMYTQGSKQVMTSAVPGAGKEVVLQGAQQGVQQGTQEAGKQVATEAGKNVGLGASAANPSWANPAAAVAAIGGRAVEHVADDNDDTRVSAGEGIGRGLAGAGQGASIGLMFGPVGGLIGAGVGALASLTTQQIQKRRAIKEAEKQREYDNQIAAAERYAFENSLVKQGQDMGYNIGNSMTNSYLPGQQQFVGEAGGRPGLWANIHAKRKRIAAGSGEKMRTPGSKGAPTDEAIKRSQAKAGGYINPLPGGAVEFVGPKHAQGGIKLDKNTEVEGGETMDKVTMKAGGSQDYIFSDYLKVGKKSFAQRHKEMLDRGASQAEIQQLAKLQEEVANRKGRDENGPRDPNMIMKRGGMYQAAGAIDESLDPDNPEFTDQGVGFQWFYDIEDENNPAIDMAGRIGREKDTAQILASNWAKRQGLSEDMTTEELEAYYNDTYLPQIRGYFNANKEQVVANAKKMAMLDDKNQSNFTKRIGKSEDGSFKMSDDEIFEEALKLTTDGNVGSWHSLLPQAPVETPDDPQFEISQTEQTTERQVPQGCPCEDGSLSPDCCDIPEKRDILLPYQLIGPAAELTTKYPQPEKIAAQPTGRIKLPRVNFNAERASLGNTTTAANKFIQNNAAGPAAISAMMATNEKQRSGNLDIANAEARNNKELAAQEELANLQASQFDSSQGMRASMFNAQAQNQRDQNEYEKRMLAFNQLGTNLAQYANDRRAYAAEERAAEAYQIDNEYSRQKAYEAAMSKRGNKKSPYYGKNPMEIKEMIAQSFQYGAPTWNAQNAGRRDALVQTMNEDGTYPMATTSMPGPTRTIQGPTITTTQTNATTTPELLSALENYQGGGYIRKFGKIKRKRRK